MDYPKSVPGVGLVNNQFVDEDQVSGTPGSLIPAAWGNAVTQELLAVIQAAGLVPSEANNAQLLAAIKSLSLGGVLTLSASATLPTTSRGLVLVNAAAAAVTVTLPASEAVGVLELTLRRTDAAANAAVIAANGADRIMLDTTAEAAGQVSTELLFAGDFLRLRSDGAGKWWCVGQAQLPGSIASGLVALSSPGAHTFTVPSVLRSGRRLAKVKVIGGGGAGGSRGSLLERGAGGGGGGYATALVNLNAVTSVGVTVGAGGVGVLGPGGSGGASSFGAYMSATGGGGGGSGPASGGLSGLGVGGAENGGLGDGSDGYIYNTDAHGSGDGGGPGGRAVCSTGQPGRDGVAAGGGGGGSGSSPATAGGNGAPGAVIIEW